MVGNTEPPAKLAKCIKVATAFFFRQTPGIINKDFLKIEAS
jgi:hypothetical protein